MKLKEHVHLSFMSSETIVMWHSSLLRTNSLFSAFFRMIWHQKANSRNIYSNQASVVLITTLSLQRTFVDITLAQQCMADLVPF